MGKRIDGKEKESEVLPWKRIDGKEKKGGKKKENVTRGRGKNEGEGKGKEVQEGRGYRVTNKKRREERERRCTATKETKTRPKREKRVAGIFFSGSASWYRFRSLWDLLGGASGAGPPTGQYPKSVPG